MDKFISKLQAIFKGEVVYDSAHLTKYSRDASLFRIQPKLIVFPKNAEDIKNLVMLVNEIATETNNYSPISLTARSAGTDMTGGPLTESVVVSFTEHFNHILEITEEYAVVEPGVYYRDFDKATREKDRILPSYPASRELCTVGGMVSNNSGGEKNLQYGKTENYILELTMVLHDGNEYTFKPLSLLELEQKKKLSNLEGEIYRNVSNLIDQNSTIIAAAKPQVSKNSAGYYIWNVLDSQKGIFDITKLLVGSQGTLGLVTKIKFKLVKPRNHSRLLIVFLKDMTHLAELTNQILTFKPESLESYDDHTFKLALKYLPALIKHMGGNVISLGLSFIPEFWMLLTGGMPKLVMMAEFTGSTDLEAHNQAVKVRESIKKYNLDTRIADSDQDVGKYWAIRRESFNLLRNHVKNLRTAPFIDDFVVKPELLPEFLPKLYKILDDYHGIIYTIQGHVGDGNFHIIPLMDLTDKKTQSVISEIMNRVTSLIFEYKGSMTGEHNDGIIRTPYLEKMYGSEITKLFKEIKNIFDPKNIFNPGKKVGGTWEYAMSRLDTPEVVDNKKV